MYEDDVASGNTRDYIYLGDLLVARRDRCGNKDDDGDGIPNCVEIRAGLDPGDDGDAQSDPDNDGLTNLQEYLFGTDFFSSDTDGDGMPDGYEVANGLLATVDDAQGDADVDGLLNLQEYQIGTNPQNRDTDGDGVSDGDEVAAGTDPLFNVATLVPILQVLTD